VLFLLIYWAIVGVTRVGVSHCGCVQWIGRVDTFKMLVDFLVFAAVVVLCLIVAIIYLYPVRM